MRKTMENDKLVRLSDVTGLLRKIEKRYHETYVSNVRADTITHCIDRIKTIPAVDAVEVRHGRWIECEDATLDVYYKCSACGNEWDIIEGTPEDNNMKYCPECGARMDGEEEHNATD